MRGNRVLRAFSFYAIGVHACYGLALVGGRYFLRVLGWIPCHLLFLPLGFVGNVFVATTTMLGTFARPTCYHETCACVVYCFLMVDATIRRGYDVGPLYRVLCLFGYAGVFGVSMTFFGALRVWGYFGRSIGEF